MDTQPAGGIGLVGFDADDTLWRSQDYFDDAQAQFERIVAGYWTWPTWRIACTRSRSATSASSATA